MKLVNELFLYSQRASTRAEQRNPIGDLKLTFITLNVCCLVTIPAGSVSNSSPRVFQLWLYPAIVLAIHGETIFNLENQSMIFC